MNNCQTGAQNSVANGFLTDVEFVTVQLQQGNSATNIDRDVLVKFAKPHTFFMLVSITYVFRAASVFLHFDKLGLPQTIGAASLTPGGGEHWIPLSNTQLAASDFCEGRWLKFGVPISQFYIDADHNGHTGAEGYYITFMGTSSIDFAVAEQS